MRKKFWQTEKFRELQKSWEERLKASGFNDAEKNGKLSQNASNCYRTKVQTVIETRQRFFELLGQGYHAEDFSDPVEKYVMGRRANGANLREISIELKKAGKKNSVETLRKIVRHFEARWGITKKKNKTKS